MPPRPFTATNVPGLQSTAAAQPDPPPPVPQEDPIDYTTEPVNLPRRSLEATRAYHEGYAAALEQMAEWLREKAHNAAVTASMHRAMANCHASPDPTADRAQVRALSQRGDHG